jgi:bisphosphoglycerate-dependent phosphoglycerate mutase
MTQLILIRYGQSTYNLENRFTGNLDMPLTPNAPNIHFDENLKILSVNYL